MAIKLDEARIRLLTTNLLNGGIALNSLNYGTYALPLAGGKMTGTIHLGSTGLRTHDDTHGYYTDQYGNFFHCSNTSTDNWNVHNNAGNMSLKYYFETGALEIPTSLKMNTWNITDDGNCIYFRKASNTNYVGFDWNSNVGHIVGNSTSTNCGYGWHNKEAANDLAYVGANIQNGTLNYFWIGKDYNNLWMKISPTGRAEFMSTAGQDDHNGIIKVINNSTYSGTGYHTVIRATAPKATGTQVFMIGPENSTRNAGYIGFYNTGTLGSFNNRLSLGLYAVDNVLNITGEGKVGVGTVTPSTKFVVYSEDTSESVATFSTSGENPWIYFKSGGTTRVASVGYYKNMACISNEKNLSRIGVTDAGIPQYWTDSAGTAKHEIILGNAYENNIGPLRLKRGSGINNATNNYISAGRGYSTGSGLNGLKLIVTEQDDAISGFGQDCAGREYELSIAAALSTSNKGYITFVGHKIATPTTYSELGHFNFNSSVFYVNGKIGIGTTVPAEALEVNGVTQSKGLRVCNRGSTAGTNSYLNSAIEIREYNFGGAQEDTWGVAPRISFHWSNRVAAQIGLASNGYLYTSSSAEATYYKLVYESGTWGINISGNASTATKATQDSSGNVITSTYLKLSGGTMTGPIYIADSGIIQIENDSSNWRAAVRWRNTTLESGTYLAGIGRHNTGGSSSYPGSINITPYATNTSPWGGSVGLFITKDQMNFEGNKFIDSTGKVYGAVWNDYAEYRWVLNHPDTDEPIESGRCVAENGNDSMSLTHDRLQAGARIISDTYGMCMGETEKAKTPIAVCGRVLAYPFERKVAFNVGDPVCSGPNGTVSKMSREEAMMYPERIVGTVVSKPTYKEWGPNKIPVKGRIWIQVR